MSDMDARDLATMRARGLNENGGPLDWREPRCTDGAPETHCRLCCEPLPEPDGQCRDPGCVVHRFNEACPVGTPVWYYPIAGCPERRETSVKYPAFVAAAGYSVCWVEGVRGYVLTSHIARREVR